MWLTNKQYVWFFFRRWQPSYTRENGTSKEIPPKSLFLLTNLQIEMKFLRLMKRRKWELQLGKHASICCFAISAGSSPTRASNLPKIFHTFQSLPTIAKVTPHTTIVRAHFTPESSLEFNRQHLLSEICFEIRLKLWKSIAITFKVCRSKRWSAQEIHTQNHGHLDAKKICFFLLK